MLGIMVFFLGALAIAAFSRRSLSDPQSHGFARFLAFEVVWALLVINVRLWFVDPFAPHHLVSWIALIASAALAIGAFLKLGAAGKSQPVAPGSPLFRFENTSRIVTTGIYKRIRHPMYASLILLAWGTALKGASFWSILLALAATGLLVQTARAEERENLERFGEPYDQYMDQTKMFIPGVF